MDASPPVGFVDLHAHLLAGLDDGSRSDEMSLLMVQALSSLGFVHAHATPHQRAGMFMPTRDAIDGAFATLNGQLAASLPAFTLGLAAENFWDEVFCERVVQGGLPCYPGRKAFLFEVPPMMIPPRLETTLFEIRVAGRLPVMAHPERYRAIQDDPRRAEAIGQTAALLVDLAALEGAHGPAAMKASRRILEEGLAHAAASDMHSPDDERAVAAGIAWVDKHLGSKLLHRLLAENPRRILTGELPDPVRA